MTNYISLCGNIGSGKSTIASLLIESKINVVFEDFEKHISLDDFYKNPEQFSFETELNFLLQHYYLLKKAKQTSEFSISDFSISLDRAYADVTLPPMRKQLFHMVADELEQEIGLPSKLIYLYCPEKILLQRIQKRNREFETAITIDYLSSLSESINYQVKLIGNKTEVIRINSHDINFVTDSDAKEKIKALLLPHIH